MTQTVSENNNSKFFNISKTKTPTKPAPTEANLVGVILNSYIFHSISLSSLKRKVIMIGK